MILYYTDIDETLGPTYVVSHEKTRDLPLLAHASTEKEKRRPLPTSGPC